MEKDLTVKKIAEICEGELFCGQESQICKTFTKDTRTIKKGDTYIGIKGETFDGNLFYKEAFLKGAICAILEKDSFKTEADFIYDKPIILVKSSLKALKDLAEYKRNHSNALFVGVTGSVGKTSTKDMIYSVLKQEYKTLKTEGNYNNNIGLPLTLLRLNEEEAAVIEMGMNALNEIDYLSKITRPHIGVITNVGTAHIGKLGSRENILKAKLEILNGMDEEGKLIINNDNDLLHQYYLEENKNCITVGINEKSDFQAKEIKMFESSSEFIISYNNKEYAITCPVPGHAFIYNSLVAFAVGTLLNITPQKIQEGIKNFELTKNRIEILKIRNEITVINGVYNANVDSMKSSLEILKDMKNTRKIAVLGSMFELGNYSKKLHEEIGKSVVQNKIDVLITVGIDAKFIASKAKEEGMENKNIYVVENNIEAINLLKEILEKGDTILLKASSQMHFSEILENLKKEDFLI